MLLWMLLLLLDVELSVSAIGFLMLAVAVDYDPMLLRLWLLLLVPRGLTGCHKISR